MGMHSPAGHSLRHQLALTLAERVRKLSLIVLRYQVVKIRLTTILVDPLRNLVSSSIPKTGKE